MNKLGIYIHVPFCVQKCRYCDFYSMAGANICSFTAYKEAIIRHLNYMADRTAGYSVDTVYFGGGTPSLLPAEMIGEIVSALHSRYKLTEDCEMTLEMNPGTADYSAMESYLQCGINRLSIGCQSADDSDLKQLGRIHSFADFVKTVSDAKRAGFTNISADLMLGLPDQNWSKLSQSIERICEREPTHISAYALKIEQGTWFYRNLDRLSLPDEDAERELYLNTVAKLGALGYRQYEISNFAKQGFASGHNLKYWRCMPYLGFGPAAYSYFEGRRFGYGRNLDEYINATLTSDYLRIEQDTEQLTATDQTEEKLLLGLRLSEGVSLNDFSFDQSVASYLEMLTEKKLAVLSGERLALTAEGMLVDNYITSELLLHLK